MAAAFQKHVHMQPSSPNDQPTILRNSVGGPQQALLRIMQNSVRRPLYGINETMIDSNTIQEQVFSPNSIGIVLFSSRRQEQDVMEDDTAENYQNVEKAEECIENENDDLAWNARLDSIDEKQIPRFFLCPITLEVMRNPVVAQDGHTYEKSAITKWLASPGEKRSPKTLIKMGTIIIPNRLLQTMIMEWVDQNHMLRDPAV